MDYYLEPLFFGALLAILGLDLLIARFLRERAYTWAREALLLGYSVLFIAIFLGLKARNLALLLLVIFLIGAAIRQLSRLSANRFRVIAGAVTLTIIAFISLRYQWARSVWTAFFAIFLGSHHPGLAKLQGLSFGAIGLPYLVCRVISLLVGVHRGEITEIKIRRIMGYLLFAPAFLSGPIHRYPSFDRDVSARPSLPERGRNVRTGGKRFLNGVLRKLALAPLVLPFSFPQLPIHGMNEYSLVELILAVYAFFIYLYFDFSGYTEMAIGVGLALGVRLPENFLNPLRSLSMAEFWNRWHVSLADWMREYIYFPLVRWFHERKLFRSRITITAVSLFVTFFVTGYWHGDSMGFFWLGIYYGVGFYVYILYTSFMTKRFKKAYGITKQKYAYIAFCWLLTFNYISFSLIFFNANFEYPKAILSALFNKSAGLIN
jgi:D-alanyl-lipoteichoic acid acyltransferase DltB (MBOAT superfamily)